MVYYSPEKGYGFVCHDCGKFVPITTVEIHGVLFKSKPDFIPCFMKKEGWKSWRPKKVEHGN
jgi:hypothetical protein